MCTASVMTGQGSSRAEIISLLVGEGKRRILTLAVIFSIVALGTLAAGTLMPKKYEASSLIFVDTRNIITPLMEGRAVGTGISDHASIVKQVIFSKRMMREILAFGGWGEQKDPYEEERMLDRLRKRITIDSPRPELIRIWYTDSSPQRCSSIANKLAEIYIRESTGAKERESREAFDFIDKQVKEYGAKLADAHAKVLAYYRAQEKDRRAPAPREPGQRPSRASPAELTALKAEEATLRAELERGKSAPSQELRQAEDRYRERALQLQGELDKLLTTYTSGHPEVERARNEIVRAKEGGERARLEREAAEKEATALDDEMTKAARARVKEVHSQIATLENRQRPIGAPSPRRDPAEGDPEMKGVGQDTTLSEMLRRYQSTQDVYQDLLKRRENARVSMDLDAERRGLAMRVQEAAEVPLTPTSLRLLHITAGGLLLALLAPIGLLVAIVRLDTRVRSGQQIERLALVPFLGSISYEPAAPNRARHRLHRVFAILIVASVFIVYVVVLLLQQRPS